MQQQLQQDLLKLAFELGAVRVDVKQPFRWASGNLMPVYNNNRLLLSNDSARRLICSMFVQLLEEKGCPVEVVVGVATAGIPHATLLADRLDLPLSYVRAAAKDHGTRSRIEGLPGGDYHGARAVLVEDVISTGGSAVSAVEAVRAQGGVPTACLAIFSYGLKESQQAFVGAACPLWTLLDFPLLLDIASRQRMLDPHDTDVLRRWYQDPFNWQQS